MYAIYENKGTLDMRALTMMGVNSKPNSDNPIGYFGTGLKYAIAVLARHGCTLHVQDSKGGEWTVKAFTENFRDKSFTMLRLVDNVGKNDIELPFTTELGKNWELWMAMRELECNAGDEGGQFELSSVRLEPELGVIRFIVEGDAFITTCRDMRKQVFYDVEYAESAVALTPFITASSKPSNGLYYRGILVHTILGKQWSHTYNVIASLDLTEDRTLKYTWEYESRIENAFIETGNHEWREKLLKTPDAAEWQHCAFSVVPKYYAEDALKQIEDFYLAGKPLHESMTKLMQTVDKIKEFERDQELMDDQELMLDTALERVALLGYDLDDIKVTVKAALPNGALGIADMHDKSMKISVLNFEHGLECLMGTIIEEFAHIRFGFSDNSREFQDWLLRQTVVQGQRYLKKVVKE